MIALHIIAFSYKFYNNMITMYLHDFSFIDCTKHIFHATTISMNMLNKS